MDFKSWFNKGAGSAKSRVDFYVTPDGHTISNAPGGLKGMFSNLGGFAKAHPTAALGTAANAGANVAGLFDNDKLLGQAAGVGLGLAAPKLLSMIPGPIGAFAGGLGTLGKANLAMGGGTLGALFDNLRAKKEQEQKQLYYGGY